MPKLGAALDFSQLEARNAVIHNLSSAPSAPIRGQLYYSTASDTLLWWDGTVWQSAKGGVSSIPDATAIVNGVVQLAGELAGGGTAASPVRHRLPGVRLGPRESAGRLRRRLVGTPRG